MTPKLAILIPTILGREHLMDRLVTQLNKQITASGAEHDVILLHCYDNGARTIGDKRNELVKMAVISGATYTAFHDDDDLPGPTYIQRQMEVVASGMDCGSLWGNIYFSGSRGKPFHHSIKYEKWWDDINGYYRCPNHLNCIKTSIVKQFPYQSSSFGEDGNFSMDMKAAGVLKTEYQIDDVIYHYFTGRKDTPQERIYVKELIG